jgi:hypothetical protein
MMKKTLVALAAVAVTGGAFAQATLTGSLGYGYKQITSTSNVVTGGMGVADASANLGLSEDLGGGMSVSGTMGFYAPGNSSAVLGNDVKLGVKTASGLAVNFASNYGAHYLTGGIAGAGANFDAGLDGKVLGTRSLADSVTVSIPLMEGATLSASHAEPLVSEYGSGAASYTAKQRYNTLTLGYKAGALVADVGFRSYDAQLSTSTTSASQKTRASASYDLGVAKIGAGTDTTNYATGDSYTESLVGITIPLGSLTVGAQFGAMSTSGYNTNYDQTGSIVGAMYNLSKRTYITAQYYSFTGGFTASTATSTAGTSNGTGAVFTIYNTF